MFLERSINQADNIGWIEVICGSMFSGKTEELIRRVKRAKLAKQKIKIFKPKQDTRYNKKKVTSHDNNSIKSRPVKSASKILELSEKFDVIGIDEAQFFDDGIIDIANRLAKENKRVVIAGLDKDYTGKYFGPIRQLMVDAEYVSKVNAICISCGDPASFSQRISKEKDLVVVGETDKYEARCRECFHP